MYKSKKIANGGEFSLKRRSIKTAALAIVTVLLLYQTLGDNGIGLFSTKKPKEIPENIRLILTGSLPDEFVRFIVFERHTHNWYAEVRFRTDELGLITPYPLEVVVGIEHDPHARRDEAASLQQASYSIFNSPTSVTEEIANSGLTFPINNVELPVIAHIYHKKSFKIFGATAGDRTLFLANEQLKPNPERAPRGRGMWSYTTAINSKVRATYTVYSPPDTTDYNFLTFLTIQRWFETNYR